MPEFKSVIMGDIVKITAKVNNDPAARIVMQYVNQKDSEKNEIREFGSEMKIPMTFSEKGFHTLVFTAFGSPEKEEGTFEIVLKVIEDDQNEILFESGLLSLKNGTATYHAWLRV